jgi:hypothetical protein
MPTIEEAVRHPGERGIAPLSKAATDWIRRLLDRIHTRSGTVAVSALGDDWLRAHARESWKHGER